MKRLLSVLMIAMPFFVLAQDGGVQFEEGLTWDEVKAKAKVENKYIFVDCYTTWCTPCKIMDRNVYPNDTVASYMNDRFISVKVQLDSSKKDNNSIKLLYPTARAFEKEYTISSIPTFLFFSPEGKIVHKDAGGKNVQSFISLVANAGNPDKQLYTLINNWKKGKYGYAEMPSLANRINIEFKENNLANEIARDYMLNYLNKLSDEQFLKKENLYFLQGFSKMITTNDRIFKAYYKYQSKIDAVMEQKDYSKIKILYIISNSMLAPATTKTGNSGVVPKWNKLYTKIKSKTNKQYAALSITSSKIEWYQNKQDHKNTIKAMVDEIDLIGPSNYTNDYELNNRAWYIFNYSINRTQLQKALALSERSLEIDKSKGQRSQQSAFFTPNQNTAFSLDTKANLLYKLGKQQEAIEIEEKAITLLPGEPALKTTLQKMKEGKPTWFIEKKAKE